MDRRYCNATEFHSLVFPHNNVRLISQLLTEDCRWRTRVPCRSSTRRRSATQCLNWALFRVSERHGSFPPIPLGMSWQLHGCLLTSLPACVQSTTSWGDEGHHGRNKGFYRAVESLGTTFQTKRKGPPHISATRRHRLLVFGRLCDPFWAD